MKEKALRDTQIRSIHEMGELKRAQESRVDKFIVQKMRESHDTIQRLTSQVQELQERVNCMNDSGEFQKNRIELQWTLFSRSQSTSSHSKSCYIFHAAKNTCHLIHGICLNHREKFLAIHALCSIHHRHLVKEFFIRLQVLQVWFQCR